MTENFAHVGWAVLAFNLLSLSLGYFIPKLFKLSKSQSTAIAFEIGVHSSGLALLVAISFLQSTTMAVPAALYSIFMYFTAAALVYVLRR